MEKKFDWNSFILVFNADCRIVHFIFHLKSKIPFDKMDLIDETGRLVGLHQLELNKPFARLMHFIKTNVSIGHVNQIFTLFLAQPLVRDSLIRQGRMILFSVFTYLWSNVKMSGVFFLQHLLISLPKLPTEFVILK